MAEGTDDPGADVEAAWVLQANDDELMDRFGRWYIADRDPTYLRRNALVALGNTAAGDDPAVAGLLEVYLVSDDSILRSHAVWAADRLGRPDLLDGLEAGSDLLVAEELAVVQDRVGA